VLSKLLIKLTSEILSSRVYLVEPKPLHVLQAQHVANASQSNHSPPDLQQKQGRMFRDYNPFSGPLIHTVEYADNNIWIICLDISHAGTPPAPLVAETATLLLGLEQVLENVAMVYVLYQ
jgi:hypothetical protein